MNVAEHYLFLKSLHLFGVILFLGNIIVTGFWKLLADYTKDWKVIAFSQRLVTVTDIIFTTIGVIIIAVTGILMAQYYGDYFRVKWIVWGLSLFIASGVIWVTILIPVQILLQRITTTFRDNNSITQRYWKYELIWMVFGVIATVLPLLNLYWMVFKPIN